MSIITISRGTFGGGKAFAENLAKKLGYPCLSREQLSEEAVKLGVPVGKLQTAMVKPPRVYQRLGVEREHYLACITSILCKHALEGDLVYHGHTGHLLFPGIPHIFRVRVLAEMEHRIASVMDQLNLSREKAIDYITAVDSDRDKWVRFLYGVDWHTPMNYDLVVNLTQMGVENASTALCVMAELPDFTLTPAAKKALRNLYLASRARFLLAHDKRTGHASVKVTADDGVVQVTYLPQDVEVAPLVPEILDSLEGLKEVHTTIAKTNILWLGENFDPKTELFQNLTKVAKKWDAAVEIMRLATEENGEAATESINVTPTVFADKDSESYDGGIEEDVEEKQVVDTAGVLATMDALKKVDCSGGSSTLYGDKETLINTLGHRTNYNLVVIGDVYSSRPEPVKRRLSSELRSLLSDNIKAPVVGEEELKAELKFDIKDVLRLASFLLIALILFLAVFTNQQAVITFLTGESYKSWRILAVLGTLIFVPVFAFTFGSSTRQVLKFFRLD